MRKHRSPHGESRRKFKAKRLKNKMETQEEKLIESQTKEDMTRENFL